MHKWEGHYIKPTPATHRTPQYLTSTPGRVNNSLGRLSHQSLNWSYVLYKARDAEVKNKLAWGETEGSCDLLNFALSVAGSLGGTWTWTWASFVARQSCTRQNVYVCVLIDNVLGTMGSECNIQLPFSPSKITCWCHTLFLEVSPPNKKMYHLYKNEWSGNTLCQLDQFRLRYHDLQQPGNF